MSVYREDRPKSYPDEISESELSEIKAKIVEIIDIALGMSGNLEPFLADEKPVSVGDRVYWLVRDAKKTWGRPFTDKLAFLAKYTLVTRYDVKRPGVADAIEALTNYYRSAG